MSIAGRAGRRAFERNRVADERVLGVLALGRALLADDADHVVPCAHVDRGRC